MAVKRLTYGLLAFGMAMMVGSVVWITWTLGADLLVAEKLFLTSLIAITAGVTGLMVAE